MFATDDARRRLARRTLLAFAGSLNSFDASGGSGTASDGLLSDVVVGGASARSKYITDTFQNGLVDMTWWITSGTWSESAGSLASTNGAAASIFYAGTRYAYPPTGGTTLHAEVRILAGAANRFQYLGLTNQAETAGLFCSGTYIETRTVDIRLVEIDNDNNIIGILGTYATVPTANMLLAIERDNAGNVSVYANGALLGSSAIASVATQNVNVVLGSRGSVNAGFNSFAAWMQ